MEKIIEVWESGYGHVKIDVPENADHDSIKKAVREELEAGGFRSNETSYSYEADITESYNFEPVIN